MPMMMGISPKREQLPAERLIETPFMVTIRHFLNLP